MTEVLNLERMARRAGVSQKWLKGAAEAGLIPCLHADKRLLFSPPVVMQTLADLATAGTAPSGTPNGGAA